MRRRFTRPFELAHLVVPTLLAASAAVGCNVDTNDLFSSGGEGGAGSSTATTSSKATVGPTTSVGTTTAGNTTSSGAMCGNGVAEAGEDCDGFDLDGQTCASLGSGSGELSCTPSCTFDLGACAAACGNGQIEGAEECDGMNLGGASCTSFGFENPVGLACDGCVLDPSGCKATCGNNALEGDEACDDGNTNANDGCSPTCMIEMPTSNGATCATAIPVSLALGAAQTMSGTTQGGGSHTPVSCQSNGPDRVYAVTPQAKGFLTATLPRALASFDSTLWVSTSCMSAQIQDVLCNDSYAKNGQALPGGEVVSLAVEAGTTYFVFVDTFSQNDSGTYTLELDLSAGTCADPVPIALEDGVGQRVIGSNAGFPVTSQGSCGGAPGGDVTYRITPLFAENMSVQTGMSTNYNSVLYARSACGDAASELSCSNQNGTAQESINFNATMGTPVFVKVDGSQAGGGSETGSYSLILTP